MELGGVEAAEVEKLVGVGREAHVLGLHSMRLHSRDIRMRAPSAWRRRSRRGIHGQRSRR